MQPRNSDGVKGTIVLKTNMTPDWQSVLGAAFPGKKERYFTPMSIGNTSASADEGASLILRGIKTATSSAFWDYPDSRIPFAGALSVLLDGQGEARAIVETVRVEIMPFGSVNEDFAHAYGEGDRTLTWWRSEIGAWYREEAARRGESFSDDMPIICEWLRTVRRFVLSDTSQGHRP
jgi:histidinol-phosphate aminotransferase